MPTRVVNRYKEKGTVSIARRRLGFHFGNPFFLGNSTIGVVAVETRREAVIGYYEWLRGTNPFYAIIEPDRRQWILDNLEGLRGEVLECTCDPSACHGHVLQVLLGEITLEDVLAKLAAEENKFIPPKADSAQIDLFA